MNMHLASKISISPTLYIAVNHMPLKPYFTYTHNSYLQASSLHFRNVLMNYQRTVTSCHSSGVCTKIFLNSNNYNILFTSDIVQPPQLLGFRTAEDWKQKLMSRRRELEKSDQCPIWWLQTHLTFCWHKARCPHPEGVGMCEHDKASAWNLVG